jgi:hypothetical protein
MVLLRNDEPVSVTSINVKPVENPRLQSSLTLSKFWFARGMLGGECRSLQESLSNVRGGLELPELSRTWQFRQNAHLHSPGVRHSAKVSKYLLNILGRHPTSSCRCSFSPQWASKTTPHPNHHFRSYRQASSQFMQWSRVGLKQPTPPNKMLERSLRSSLERGRCRLEGRTRGSSSEGRSFKGPHTSI